MIRRWHVLQLLCHFPNSRIGLNRKSNNGNKSCYFSRPNLFLQSLAVGHAGRVQLAGDVLLRACQSRHVHDEVALENDIDSIKMEDNFQHPKAEKHS